MLTSAPLPLSLVVRRRVSVAFSGYLDTVVELNTLVVRVLQATRFVAPAELTDRLSVCRAPIAESIQFAGEVPQVQRRHECDTLRCLGVLNTFRSVNYNFGGRGGGQGMRWPGT